MTNSLTNLVIDDEEFNLDMLNEYLTYADYNVMTASSGEEGLDMLTIHHNDIDIVLLDRMMPGMDGLEVLKRMKSTNEFSNIPVIMQTAAAGTKHLIEGNEAGAYYYLTKPFDKQTLLAIVGSAAQTIEQREQFSEEFYENFMLIDCTESSYFKLRDLEQTQKLAVYLGKMCPPSRITGYSFSELSYGFSEILINAVEHGNLGISYEEKSNLLKQGKDVWRAEILKRLLLEEHREKYVRVVYEHHGDEIVVFVEDQGRGFNWQPFLEIDPARSTDNHGRGIALANAIFDDLTFHGQGNQVVCRIKI